MDVQRILVAVDGTEQAKKALDFACDLSKSKAAELIIAHVQKEHGMAFVPEELKRYNEIEHVNITEDQILSMVANEVLQDAEKQVLDSGVANSKSLLSHGNPANTLVQLAADEQADLLVVGSRGFNNLKGLLFGSTSQAVESKAGCTVIVVH